MKIIFWCGAKCLGLAQNVYQFLDGHKTFLNPKRTRHKGSTEQWKLIDDYMKINQKIAYLN